jgi:hypothetical protein
VWWLPVARELVDRVLGRVGALVDLRVLIGLVLGEVRRLVDGVLRLVAVLVREILRLRLHVLGGLLEAVEQAHER